MDPEQSRDLADSQPFAEMVQDLQDGLVRELGVEQHRALELGEPRLTGIAVQEPMVVCSECSADREITRATLTMEPTVRILATEAGEVRVAVHNGDILVDVSGFGN